MKGAQQKGNRPSDGNKMTKTLCKPHKDEKSRSLGQGPGGIQLWFFSHWKAQWA